MKIADAIAFAQYLLRVCPNKVAAVGLFGSVARTHKGNDLDVILFVTNLDDAEKFRRGVSLEIFSSDNHQRKRTVRRKWAKTVLSVECLTPPEVPETVLDVIIYPFDGSLASAVEKVELSSQSGWLQSEVAAGIIQDLQIYRPADCCFHHHTQL